MSSSALLQTLRRLRQEHKWAIGIAVAATPAAAILQGAFLLQDFRKNHGNAPVPVSPSRGIVVVQNETSAVATSSIQPSSNNQDDNYQLKPLRLLVIGDSLAAGVGVSTQGTPILPESIAKSLSHASGGRAVQWTCVGTPGATASQIVHDITSMEAKPTLLETKLVEWQVSKKRAQEWLEERKRQLEAARKKEEKEAVNKIKNWWLRARSDVTSFRKQVLLSRKDTEVQEIIQQRRRFTKRRLSKGTGDITDDEYDIAIVLTGLNDLKDMALPFMTSGANSGTSEEARRSQSSEGVAGELLRVLQALKDKMKLPNNSNTSRQRQQESDNEKDDDLHNNKTREQSPPSELITRRNSKQPGPLVVFPSLPIAPLPFAHHAPLSWFIVPLLRMMDSHKQRLAETFPDYVLFVESPSMESVQDMEAGRGRIFRLKKAEQVLLRLTDVKERAREKVEELMKQHYQRWTQDKEEDQQQQQQQQDVYHVGCHDHLPATSDATPAVGSTMVAVDNVHPNDAGYDFWGRHIAAAIVAEWDKLEAVQATSPSTMTADDKSAESLV